MIKKFQYLTKLRLKRLRRNIKQLIYNFLVAIYEGEIRITLFGIMCAMFCLTLLIGCLLPKGKRQLVTTSATTLGNKLTLALHDTATGTKRTDLNADVTLFLLPESGTDADLATLNNSPLYGFYLTGEEVAYLPEYYTSLIEAFPDMEPYIGGLSFSYNPNRISYNRVTDISLFSQDGIHSPLEKDTLYYVIGNDSVFGMFRYLYEQTYHLIRIQPKDASGIIIADYSGQMIRGQHGSYNISDIYSNFTEGKATEQSDASRTVGEIFLCRSMNTIELFAHPNIASLFIFSCMLLLFALTLYIRPNLRRIRIWFRIFLIRRKKRGKISLRDRITSAYSAKLAHRRAA